MADVKYNMYPASADGALVGAETAPPNQPQQVRDSRIPYFLGALFSLAFGIAAAHLSVAFDAQQVAVCNPSVTEYTKLWKIIGAAEIVIGICQLFAFLIMCRVFREPERTSDSGATQPSKDDYRLAGCGCSSQVVTGLLFLVVLAGGVVSLVTTIVGSVRTWQPGWASLACLQTDLWLNCHRFYLARWVCLAGVPVLWCLINLVRGCCKK